MSDINLDELLQGLSPDAPCGEDLEYDAAFGEMERAAEGKPEQQFGDTIVPAEEADWREVRRKAMDLLSRSKDLRAAVYLAQAELSMDGLPAFRDCLALLRGYIEQYWDTVHPQLDPDDDNDPTFRVNTFTSLFDTNTTLLYLKKTPLVESRAVGKFSLYDIEVAHGELPPPADEEPPGISTIEAAFLDCDLDELQQTATAVRESLEHVKALESVLTEQVGVGNAASFDPLAHVLGEAEKRLAEQLTRRGAGDPSADSGEEEEGEGEADGGQSGGGAVQSKRLSGEITTREDVVRALDMICDFYDRYEPSSPLPLLLKRAKRLTNKTFMEIIRDLAPDGISQAESIGGITEEADD